MKHIADRDLEDTREPPDPDYGPDEDDPEYVCPECHGEGFVFMRPFGWVICPCNKPKRKISTPPGETQ